MRLYNISVKKIDTCKSMYLFKLFIVFLFLFANAANAFTSITVFGDSALDGGNDETAVRSYYKLNGDAFPVDSGIAHVPVLDFRFTDGYTFIEVMAQNLNLFSPTTFFNYAFAGQLASDLAVIIPDYLNAPETQIDPDGLYVIQVGMNDLISLGRKPEVVSDEVVSAINSLHQQGAQHFLLINSIIGGDTPAFSGNSDQDKIIARNETLLFNQFLQTKIDALSFAENVTIFDLGQLINDIVTGDSGLYGIENVVDACITGHSTGGICNNIQDYFFWDDVHFSEKGHLIIGQVLSSLINQPEQSIGVRLNHSGENTALTQNIPITLAALTTNANKTNTQSVSFYTDNNLIATVSKAPYRIDWLNDQTGEHALTAIVNSVQGNVQTSEPVLINTTAGTDNEVGLYLFNTSTGNTQGSLTINPAGSLSPASMVELVANDTMQLQTFVTSPYVFNWENAPNGSYRLVAKVYDDDNQLTESSPVDVIIDSALENQAPQISLNAPISNNNFISGSLLANASDPDGTIDRVTFMVDGVEMVTDETGPYWLIWDGVPTGRYVLNGVAYDNNGLRTISDPIIVNVGTL